MNVGVDTAGTASAAMDRRAEVAFAWALVHAARLVARPTGPDARVTLVVVPEVP